MESRERTRRTPRPRPRTATTLALLLGAALMVMWLPAQAAAAITLAEPADAAHMDYLSVAPTVSFNPGVDAQPKWVLIATDAGMTTTVRYCRYFVWVQTQTHGTEWGCNRWATGLDATGADILQPLIAGRTYYWQVVAKASQTDPTEVKSEVRSFTIDAQAPQQSIADISNQVVGTVFDDGTQLNLGAAAYVNSKVKVAMPSAKRLATYAFRIHVQTSGAIDASKSYIQIKSAAGTRYVKVSKVNGGVQGVYTLNAAERKLSSKRFTYGVFVKSVANGSMVRSRYAVIVIKSAKKTSTATSGTHVPVWIPD